MSSFIIVLLSLSFPLLSISSTLELNLKEAVLLAEGAKLSVQNAKAEQLSFLDNTNSPKKAKGLILAFKSWPRGKDKASLLTKLNKAGLKKKAEYDMFKTWVFEWKDQSKHKVEEAEKLCKKFSSLSFLDYCEPDYMLSPAFKRRKKTIKPKVEPIEIEPTDELLFPQPVFTNSATGENIKNCNIVPSKFNLYGGSLSDYWAQDRVGADLLKEELKKAPPIKKHLVAIYDTPSNPIEHDIGVKNLISGSGRQATLPPLGNNMTNSNVTFSSYYLEHSQRFLKIARETCEKTDNSQAQR